MGTGEAIETHHSILIKDELIEPDADLTSVYMNCVSAKAGSNIEIALPLIGN